MRQANPTLNARSGLPEGLRSVILALGLLGLALSLAFAQEPGRDAQEPYKIFAVLWRGETEVEDGLRDQLTQLGIPFELIVRNLALDTSNAPLFVEEIRQVQPDLIYTWGTGATLSIVGQIETDEPERFVRDIPGIFVLVAYPIEARIIRSFMHPGRSVTGVSFLAPVEVQLSAIRAYRPFERIAVIYDPTAGNSQINVDDLRNLAPKLGIDLIELPVPIDDEGKPNPDEIPNLIAEAKRKGAELLYMGPDSFLTRHGDLLTALAIEVGLPTFASTQAPLRTSRAMFGLVTDYYTLGRLAALQAEKILVDGVRSDDLPIRRLARYKLWINMDVVHEIGLYPPLEMIAIADFRTSPQRQGSR